MRGLPVFFPYVALPAIDVQASRGLSWLQVNSFIAPTKKPDTLAGLFQSASLRAGMTGWVHNRRPGRPCQGPLSCILVIEENTLFGQNLASFEKRLIH